MVVAGNTSPHAPPSLNLPTQSETPPKTLLGRLLLRGRPADEPENTEKVYPWYVVLWLSRGRLFLEPRIPTGHSSPGCWCPLSTGNGCAGTGSCFWPGSFLRDRYLCTWTCLREPRNRWGAWIELNSSR